MYTVIAGINVKLKKDNLEIVAYVVALTKDKLQAMLLYDASLLQEPASILQHPALVFAKRDSLDTDTFTCCNIRGDFLVDEKNERTAWENFRGLKRAVMLTTHWTVHYGTDAGQIRSGTYMHYKRLHKSSTGRVYVYDSRRRVYSNGDVIDGLLAFDIDI